MPSFDTSTRMWQRIASAGWLLCVAACTRPTQAEPQPKAAAKAATTAAPAAVAPPAVPKPVGYDVPERSEQELVALLDRTCTEAAEQGRPWLVEITASWCGDCRELSRLEAMPELQQELSEWPRARVNIGNFDRHKALRKWLDTRAIAQWSVLEGSVCSPALGHSPVLEQRTLEPRSGVPVTAQALADWLRDAREAWRAPAAK